MEAGVSRSAFYTHFTAPDDCIEQLLEHRFAETGEQLSQASLSPDTLLLNNKPLSYFFFEHIEQNVEIYRRLFDGSRGATVLEAIRRTLAKISYDLHEPLRAHAESWDEASARLAAEYLSGALLATARVWVNAGCTQTRSEIAYWFSAMAAPGLLQQMGIPWE